ncbi:MAG: FapA family protein, partial [Gemmataceae bacterium]|nr:FapA family protein [Gemmataceae bacterium]
MRFISFLVLAVLAAVACAAEEAPPPRRIDVAALVKQLGSDDFATREAASAQLATLPVDAVPPELLAAQKSADLEVRDRATAAAKALRQHIALTRLTRAGRFAARGQVDLYVAATAGETWKADDARVWEPALALGKAALARADTKGDRLVRCPALGDFEAFRTGMRRRYWVMAGRYESEGGLHPGATQAGGLTAPGGFAWHLVVSRGSVDTWSSQRSQVLATGDFECGQDVSESLVICDGDVRVKENVYNCVILARGSISIKGIADRSTLIAGGTVTYKPLDRPLPDQRNDVEEKS